MGEIKEKIKEKVSATEKTEGQTQNIRKAHQVLKLEEKMIH